MENILVYDLNNDSEVFLHHSLPDLGISISACTVANSDGKSNEDSFLGIRMGDLLWLAVFDGVTSLKAIPGLDSQSGARFSSHYLVQALPQVILNEEISVEDALLKMNGMLLEKAMELGGNLEDTHSLPASMGTIVRIDLKNHIINFAHVGDTYGVIYKENEDSLVFTDDKNKSFDQGMFDLMSRISKEKGITIRQARQEEEVKKALYEMFIRRNNNPDGSGSGLINGDPNVAKYVQTGEYMLENIRYLLLATDGLEIQGFSLDDSQYRKHLLVEYQSGGLKKLIYDKKENEDKDPDWNNIRYKHSDDATGIMIEFL